MPIIPGTERALLKTLCASNPGAPSKEKSGPGAFRGAYICGSPVSARLHQLPSGGFRTLCGNHRLLGAHGIWRVIPHGFARVCALTPGRYLSAAPQFFAGLSPARHLHVGRAAIFPPKGPLSLGPINFWGTPLGAYHFGNLCGRCRWAPPRTYLPL